MLFLADVPGVNAGVVLIAGGFRSEGDAFGLWGQRSCALSEDGSFEGRLNTSGGHHRPFVGDWFDTRKGILVLC